MRTITDTMFERLAAQAEEAELQGLTKIAEHITYQLETNKPRSSGEFYSYSSEEVQEDVEKELWSAVIRIADFYNVNIDAANMNQVIEDFAENLMEQVRIKTAINHGVGAYEPTLPGEVGQHIEIEVEE